MNWKKEDYEYYYQVEHYLLDHNGKELACVIYSYLQNEVYISAIGHPLSELIPSLVGRYPSVEVAKIAVEAEYKKWLEEEYARIRG